MKIIRRDFSQGGDKEEQTLKPDELALDRLIYRRIGSLTDNKSITTPQEADTEFDRWLLSMNDLFSYKYYPELYTGPTPTPALLALDEYLGSLGMGIDYPFPDDTYYIENWIEVDTQTAVRVLMDEADNTYLTDGDEVLVYYT